MIKRRKKDIVSLISYRRKDGMNIGTILFGFIFVYVLFGLVFYLTTDRTKPYEVRQGSLLKDKTYTALVLRDEYMIEAKNSGYINYFYDEGTKVASYSDCYTLSPSRLQLENDEDQRKMSQDDWQAVLDEVKNFNQIYKNGDFSAVYEMEDSIDNILTNSSSNTHIKQLLKDKADADRSIQVCEAGKDGVLVYSYDGYEDVTLENLNDDLFRRSEYKKKKLSDGREVQPGDTVFKLISGDSWKLVVQLDSETLAMIEDTMLRSDKDYMNLMVRFMQDDISTKAYIELVENEQGRVFGVITVNNSMIRYYTSRFLNVELIFENQTGLKIPKTSVTKRDFYMVPMEFITKGGATSSGGVQLKGDGTARFTPVSIYYQDYILTDEESSEKQQFAYISKDELSEGDVILKPESTDTFTVEQLGTLKGVYVINRGYTVFKEVQILCESDDYYIVKEGDIFSLSNYDRIALNSKGLNEYDVVRQ